jgi:hypothetical protein
LSRLAAPLRRVVIRSFLFASALVLAGCANDVPAGPRFTVTELTGAYRAFLSADEWYYLTVLESSGFTFGYASTWNGRWTVEGRIEPTGGPVAILHGAAGTGVDRNGKDFEIPVNRVRDHVSITIESVDGKPRVLVCDSSRVFGMDLTKSPLRFERDRLRFEPPK